MQIKKIILGVASLFVVIAGCAQTEKKADLGLARGVASAQDDYASFNAKFNRFECKIEVPSENTGYGICTVSIDKKSDGKFDISAELVKTEIIPDVVKEKVYFDASVNVAEAFDCSYYDNASRAVGKYFVSCVNRQSGKGEAGWRYPIFNTTYAYSALTAEPGANAMSPTQDLTYEIALPKDAVKSLSGLSEQQREVINTCFRKPDLKNGFLRFYGLIGCSIK